MFNFKAWADKAIATHSNWLHEKNAERLTRMLITVLNHKPNDLDSLSVLCRDKIEFHKENLRLGGDIPEASPWRHNIALTEIYKETPEVILPPHKIF